ncbi:hypothetical protein Hypma_006602 [Hypsizygus marmoreus]|uniref:Uncharacterized protein n=1 Tax=Hypsizygus marmoreus TaxID=39966 RepID=A0A369JVH2_HYPMA|nr:hypothetical protein Hypma_006602 [Hypsizygus marmoreus]
MSDTRRFVFLLPSGKVYGKGQVTSGTYTKMQFCIGGKSRMPFPLNIECSTEDNATQCLSLLQPIADRFPSTTPQWLIEAISDSREWLRICAFMNNMSGTFYAVDMGKRVGIFTTQYEAQASLDDASADLFKQCDHFFSFHGAFLYMTSGGRSKTDFLGPGTGDKCVQLPPDDAPDVFASGWSIPGPSQQVLRGIPDPETPKRARTTRTGPFSVGDGSPRSSAVKTPISYGTASAGVSVQVSPLVNVQVQRAGTSRLEYQMSEAPRSPSPLRRTAIRMGKAAVRDIQDPRDYGFWFDFYLQTHGFTDTDAITFHNAYQQSDSQEGFVGGIVSAIENISEGEAKYVFRLMSERPAGRDD